MVSCTLDYEWPTYVVASLISLFGGLLIMLLVRFARRYVDGSCLSVRSSPLHKHLLSVQEAADAILSGDSIVSKVVVSFTDVLFKTSCTVTVTTGRADNGSYFMTHDPRDPLTRDPRDP